VLETSESFNGAVLKTVVGIVVLCCPELEAAVNEAVTSIGIRINTVKPLQT
jgi:hypothetical protein